MGDGYCDDFDLCAGCQTAGSCFAQFVSVDYVFYVAAVDLVLLFVVSGVERAGTCSVVVVDYYGHLCCRGDGGYSGGGMS